MSKRKLPRKTLRHVRLEVWGTGLGIQCKDDEGENSILVLSPEGAVQLAQKLTDVALKIVFDAARDLRVRAAEKRRRGRP